MSSKSEVYIVEACRTPIGSFCGAFQNTPAHDLGAAAIKEALKRSQISPDDISEVILGQTLTAGQGQNPVRQASLKAGIPTSIPAYGVNMLCGSGLKAVHLAWTGIVSGESRVSICGGQENMSMAPHAALMRQGVKMGAANFEDTLLKDGLVDSGLKIHMGETAEHLAEKFQVSREIQDEFALCSQLKAYEAMSQGHFINEVVPVLVKKGRNEALIIEDEYPKKDSSLEKLSLLKPVFVKPPKGTVTAGNASGINDGAAVLILAEESYVDKHNLNKMAKIVAFSQAGCEPVEMGLGPIYAIPKLLKKANWTINDVDLFELNEAFAVQGHLCVETLEIPKDKVNVSGGAIALGHPIGASGARILVTLVHNLERLNKKRGIASLCVGGGMGIAVAIERVRDPPY